MKICYICKLEKSLDSFNKNSSRKDGLQARCRECDRKIAINKYPIYKEKHIARGIKRKKEIALFVREIKSKLGCSKCEDKRHYVLDFHHKDDNKKNTISRMVAMGLSNKTIQEEIDKCVILCSNCHRELHWLKTHSVLAEVVNALV